MKLILALLLAAAQVSPAIAQQGSAVETARSQKLEDALQAINTNRMEAALQILDPLLADYEKEFGREKRTVFCAEDATEGLLYLSGHAVAAEKGAAKTRDAVAIGPNWCMALWAKGYVLNDQNLIDQALPYLERATAMAPLNAHYLSELGHSYQTQRKWEAALDAFTRAAGGADHYKGDRRTAELGRAWRGMGFNLIELGRWEEAEATFRKCIDLNPNDAKAKGELDYIAQQRVKSS